MSFKGSPVPAKALVLLTDLVDPAVLAVAKQGLQAFGCALCLQSDGAAAAAGLSGAPTAVPPLPLVLGLCCLTRPAGAPKPVLQVRCRPASFVLRDFCVAVGRLATGGEHGSGSGGDDGATVAAALHQLVGVMAQDAACAAAGPHKTVLLLTDRTTYEPSELYASFEVRSLCLKTCSCTPLASSLEVSRHPHTETSYAKTPLASRCWCREQASAEEGQNSCLALLRRAILENLSSAPAVCAACLPLQFCRSKGVRLELVLLDTAAEGASAVTDALAAAWGEAEAVFAHVSATFVQCASRLAFSALASTLLQRYAPRPALAVSLQVRCLCYQRLGCLHGCARAAWRCWVLPTVVSLSCTARGCCLLFSAASTCPLVSLICCLAPPCAARCRRNLQSPTPLPCHPGPYCAVQAAAAGQHPQPGTVLRSRAASAAPGGRTRHAVPLPWCPHQPGRGHSVQHHRGAA